MKQGIFLKRVAVLGGAKGISQAIVLIASPLLTRIFSPEDFGVFAVFGVLVGFLGGLSCLKYETALPLARDEVEAANIFALCGVVLSLFLCVLCVAILSVYDDIADWLKSPGLRPYLWLIPVGVLSTGLALAGQHWAVRSKDFRRIAVAGIAGTMVVLMVQFCLGIMRLGPAGLIFGRIGGSVCSCIFFLHPPLRNARLLTRNVSVQSLTEVAKKHRRFPLFFAFSSGASSFGRLMPIMILSIFFGPAVTGLYELTRRVVNVPMLLIGDEVRRVYYPYAAEMDRVDDLRHFSMNLFVSLVKISLPGALIIALVAPELFKLVFGERWKESGIYAQWLCPWLFLTFVCAPLTRLPLIMEKQKSELVFQIIVVVARGAALVVGGLAQDVMLAIILFAGSSLLCWLGFMIWVMSLIRIRVIEVLGVLSVEVLFATPIVAPLVLAKFVFLGPDDDLLLLALGAGCALVAAIVLLFRMKHVISLKFKSRAP
jgi:O-antigen/teichoic acid export membrane protein